MTKDEIKNSIIYKRGRWGTYHYELSFENGDYQKSEKITGDTEEEVFEEAIKKYCLTPARAHPA